jgi:hypothetical protein
LSTYFNDLLTYSLSQLGTNERLEDGKEHIENVRIIDNVNSFKSQWNALLNPLQNLSCKRWSEMNNLTQRESIHVKNYAEN